MKKDCEFVTAPNHSKDRTTVYCGREEPVTLCGYHASPGWIATALSAVRSTKN